jgi:hypothetical protein
VPVAIIKWLLEKEKRYAWSLTGVIVSVLSLLVAYLLSAEKRPNVSLSVVNESNVLDVHAAVRDLEVLFQRQDLEKAHLNLKIVTVRLQNVGDVDILQGQYDSFQSWGFGITPGRIIQVRVVGGNSDYLVNSLRPTIVNNSAVRFEKVILERKRFATIEILVVHPKSSQPFLFPFGKIAGIDRIRVDRRAAGAEEGSIWIRSIAGSLGVQAIRVLVYTLAFFLLVILFAGTLAAVDTRRAEHAKRRRKQIAAEIRHGISSSTKEHELFLDLFENGGERLLTRAGHIIDSPAQLTVTACEVQSRLEPKNEMAQRHADLMLSDNIEANRIYGHDRYITRKLLDAGAIQWNRDNEAYVSEDAREALKEILAALPFRSSSVRTPPDQ